jgi:hypothetical protein
MTHIQANDHPNTANPLFTSFCDSLFQSLFDEITLLNAGAASFDPKSNKKLVKNSKKSRPWSQFNFKNTVAGKIAHAYMVCV